MTFVLVGACLCLGLIDRDCDRVNFNGFVFLYRCDLIRSCHQNSGMISFSFSESGMNFIHDLQDATRLVIA